MENCIFCKIVEATAESTKIYEDKNFLAILDTIPAVKGQTIIILKEHRPSYVFALEDEKMKEYTMVAKTIAKMLEKGLKVGRVQLIFAGATVNHMHAKLYPTDKKITIEGQQTTHEELEQVKKELTVNQFL